MAEKLTPQQQLAVSNRGGNLLVSAAAGSGKTKVLVDRLLSYIMDENDPADLDEFLIITYTKAAAAELRGKIASKLSERMSQNPGNRHLQKQMQRLYLTKISTVHAFCSDILREHAYLLDISGDFRVAEEAECLELQLNIIEKLLDNCYENISDDVYFKAFVDSQGLGRDDRQIPEIILKVYNSSKCHINPGEWLDWCVSVNEIKGLEDAADTIWGKYLINDLHSCIDLHIKALSNCIRHAEAAFEMEKPAALLRGIVQQLRLLRSCDRWDDIVRNVNIDYGRLTFSKKCTDTELVEKIKAVRNGCKAELEKKFRRFSATSYNILCDIDSTEDAVKGLVRLVLEFSRRYDTAKRNLRILDFGDLEHKTLDLFMGKNRTSRTATASKIAQRYREIMVDEYQDTNAVQDQIFHALTCDKNNCFMVGDVKQSIYQFRLADPGIFLEKYNTYMSAVEALNGEDRKIVLSHNFRSGAGVIDGVNDVFSACMCDAVGGLSYGEEESLKEGIPHIPLNDAEVELYGVQVQEDTYSEEASFVAQRICELLDGKHMVRHGEELRPITPDDIVILLRSPGSVGLDFCLALEDRGVHCTTGGGIDILRTEEVSTFRSLLHIIQNPLQDIHLLTVLTSRIYCFTANDLACIRSENRKCSLYEALCLSTMDKAKLFLAELNSMRTESRMLSLTQLPDHILSITRMDSIYAAMPDGENKTENLQTFCQMISEYDGNGQRDLGRFLDYLNLLDQRGITIGSDKATDGAVSIMSIHKSKGLEFPVVFLCGLSREFNKESARAQVLCDKDLGLGLSCVDSKKRLRYPTLAKHAIAAKILSEGLSEEMRVLYVAMTRARDRLVMTYAEKGLDKTLSDLAMRLDMSDSQLLSAAADCPGAWVLQTAMKRSDAGAFFSLGGCPECSTPINIPWKIQVVEAPNDNYYSDSEDYIEARLDENLLARMGDNLSFLYPYISATKTPSKQTATQLKGRIKDQESAEYAHDKKQKPFNWRKPTFVDCSIHGKTYGNTIHTVMQYIQFDRCDSEDSISVEIQRMVDCGYISTEQAKLANIKKIKKFFDSEIGCKLLNSNNVLREFKFTILENAEKYDPSVKGESVLMQGVVDCAIIDSDGITIIDFKTDYVSEDTVDVLTEKYSAQVHAYADALSRIYQLPVKSKWLYLFHIDRFVEI